MYTLYWAKASANMTPHALLEEIGAPFELIEIDLDNGGQHDPKYLKLNPHARVPTLIYDGDKVLYEAAAISLFLCERHPELGLAPPPGHPDRGPFLQWMAYMTNTIQECLIAYWHPDRFIDGDAERAALNAAAERRSSRLFGFVDRHLAEHGPFLCGKTLYVCDYYMVMMVRWTRLLKEPAHELPHINKLVRAILARPGYARMLKAEGLEQPV